eukprot:scaffold60844_cov21-Tisochrysis_lutea.AAC.2
MAAIKQQQKCPACKVSCLQPGLPGEQSLKNHDSTTHQHSPSVSWTSAAEVSHLWESSPLSRLPGKLDFKRLDSMAQNWGSMPQPVIHLDGSSRGAQLARRDACKGRVAPCGGGWTTRDRCTAAPFSQLAPCADDTETGTLEQM